MASSGNGWCTTTGDAIAVDSQIITPPLGAFVVDVPDCFRPVKDGRCPDTSCGFDHVCHGGMPVEDVNLRRVDNVNTLFVMWTTISQKTIMRRSVPYERDDVTVCTLSSYAVLIPTAVPIAIVLAASLALIWTVSFSFDSLVWIAMPVFVNALVSFGQEILSYGGTYRVIRWCRKFFPHLRGLSRAEWYANEHNGVMSVFQRLAVVALGNTVVLLGLPRNDIERRILNTAVNVVFYLLAIGMIVRLEPRRVMMEFFASELIQQVDWAFYDLGMPVHPNTIPRDPHEVHGGKYGMCDKAQQFIMLTAAEIREKRAAAEMEHQELQREYNTLRVQNAQQAASRVKVA